MLMGGEYQQGAMGAALTVTQVPLKTDRRRLERTGGTQRPACPLMAHLSTFSAGGKLGSVTMTTCLFI